MTTLEKGKNQDTWLTMHTAYSTKSILNNLNNGQVPNNLNKGLIDTKVIVEL